MKENKDIKKPIDKKKLIPIIAIVLVIAAAVTFFSVRAYKNKKARENVAQYLSQHLETYGELNIVSDCVEVDGNKYSIAGIKESARLGADTVTLDLCFNSEDVPVICGSYDEITDGSLKLEDVFKLLKEEKYSALQINLRLRQLGSLQKFNDLILKYNMSSRVIISGIDKNRYSLISSESTSAGLFFDYTPAAEAKDALNEITALQKEYGIAGVIIDCESITDELSELLSQRGTAFIVSGADEELQMYSSISTGACNIETAYPDKLDEIYNNWKEETRNSIDRSIVDSLK